MKLNRIYSISLGLLFSNMIFGQPYSDYIGGGHDKGITVTTSSTSGNSTGLKTINGSGLDAKIFDASRFLAQASFGAKLPYIQSVSDMGYEQWIDDQFTKTPTYYTPAMYQIWQDQKNQWAAAGIDTSDVFGPYSLTFNYTWWDINMKKEDVLRQRVAQALSEILVISTNSDIDSWAEAITSYFDIMVAQSFGNYKDLLTQVSLHPAMGYYLSHLNNPKTNEAENIRPDENYAREIMQLFTIGLYKLNMDGSQQLDFDGLPIPTYDNDDIKQMAKVFTGLGCGALIDPTSWPYVPIFGVGMWAIDKRVPMAMYSSQHEPGPKYLMDGYTIPSGQTGMQDITQAINFLFNHQNTAPFVSYRLIQRLVKSNPSPEYIGRVAAKFANNGSGVRGDMKAVVKAILLDPEAREGDAMLEKENGQFRNGTLRYLQFMRTSDLIIPTNRYWVNGYDFYEATLHLPFKAPSVFNFYLPNFQPIGPIADLDLVAPEFKSHNTSTAINYINRVHAAVQWNAVSWSWQGNDPDTDEPLEPTVELNTSYLESIADDPEKMINFLDKILTHGQLSDFTRSNMRTAMTSLYWTWNTEWKWYRARMLMYMFLISPDYTTLK